MRTQGIFKGTKSIWFSYNYLILWSGREDLNLRLPAPKAGALPGCATPRYHAVLLPSICPGCKTISQFLA
jgi:hypothetical protein